MSAPAPASLTAAAWQRQAKALAAAKPAAVDQRLADFERAAKALDLSPFDAAKVKTEAEGRKLLAELEGPAAAALRKAREAARAVEAALGKWQEQHRREPQAREALAAAAAMARDAAAWRDAAESAAARAHAALTERLQALQPAAAPAPGPAPETPERRRVRTRLLEQFRIVKNRPDRPVHFLLCVGRQQASAWLHPQPVSDSQKPLLLKTLQGDTGFKWYRGRCVWEEGAYTFVGPRLNMVIARRITDGIARMTHGTKYRIRAHE